MWESSVNMPDVSASKAGLSVLLRLPGSSLLRKVPGSSILFKYENLLLRTLLRWTQVGRSSSTSCACKSRPPPSPGTSLAELQSAISEIEKVSAPISPSARYAHGPAPATTDDARHKHRPGQDAGRQELCGSTRHTHQVAA